MQGNGIWRPTVPRTFLARAQETSGKVVEEYKGRYHCLFKQGFGPLRKVMEIEDQRCLGLFLLELNRHREKLLNNTATQAHPQRTITTFFSPITPNATNQSRDTQMVSWPGHNKGVTIDWVIAICRARRPRPHGPWPQHPCHRQIKAIISRHHRCFPCFGDISILDRPMLEIFRRQKLQYI